MSKGKDPRKLTYRALRDLDLVEKIKKGDEKAVSTMFTRYSSGLFYLLLRMVKRKDVAEELVLETIAKAIRGIDTYSGEYAFSTWLYRIAANTAIDWMRTQNKREQWATYIESEEGGFVPGNEISYPPRTYDLETENVIQHIHAREMFKKIFKHFPPKHKKVIYMRIVEGRKTSEISRVCNIPPGTVYAILRRANLFLKSIVERQKKS